MVLGFASSVLLLVQGLCLDGTVVTCSLARCAYAVKVCDGGHFGSLADGGTNALENIEPLQRAEHTRRHSEAGDFKRWGERGQGGE
jgi:hypothetical protein